MEPRHFHEDAAAQGFTKPAKDFGLYLFDSFKVFDGQTYRAINNYPGKQNALARVGRIDFVTFEILGHSTTSRKPKGSANPAVTGAVRAAGRLVSKGSGGLSGHVMHRDGECGGKFSHVQFLDSQFNENYGFGLRQDGMGEHAVIERYCQFNDNRINGGLMWEITYPLPPKAEVVGEDIPVHRQRRYSPRVGGGGKRRGAADAAVCRNCHWTWCRGDHGSN